MQVLTLYPMQSRGDCRAEDAINFVPPDIGMNKQCVAITIQEVTTAQFPHFRGHVPQNFQSSLDRGHTVLPERLQLIEQIAEGIFRIGFAHG